MLNRCKEVQNILEKAIKELEIYENFANTFGYYCLNEEGEMLISLTNKIKRCAMFADTMDDFYDNLQLLELDKDNIEIKSFIEDALYKL